MFVFVLKGVVLVVQFDIDMVCVNKVCVMFVSDQVVIVLVEVNVQVVQVVVDQMVICVLFDGIVFVKYVNVGDNIMLFLFVLDSKGVVVMIVDMDMFEVEVDVVELNIVKICVEQLCEIQFDVLLDMCFVGCVLCIVLIVDCLKVIVFVKVCFVDCDECVLFDMSVKIVFLLKFVMLQDWQLVMVVQVSVVVECDGWLVVFVVKDDSVYVVVVMCGMWIGELVVVCGVKLGDMVVFVLDVKLKDGVKVIVVKKQCV